MHQNVFYEMEFLLLIVFSLVIPIGIYGFLFKKVSISRWTVGAFATVLLVVAGINVILLQHLSHLAEPTGSLIDGKILTGQLSLALYLFPLLFGGLGVNLLSHVLVHHLNEAERAFEKEIQSPNRRGADSGPLWPRRVRNSGGRSEAFVLIVCAVGTAVIFALDLLTGAEIRLHVLYVFPVSVVATYCARLSTAIAALFVIVILQVITFSKQAIGIPSFITDTCVALAASILITFFARTSRSRYLAAVNQGQTDPLTSLPNRRALMAKVETEMTRQKRYGGVFSLAVLDLDGFKALNDSKGHHAGDEALRLAADILRHCTRESDLVARIGGDEFVVLMLSTQDEDCKSKFQELCATIAQRMAAAGFDITASIGCKTFREPPESTSHALQLVDEVMYEAKRRGKNRAEHL